VADVMNFDSQAAFSRNIGFGGLPKMPKQERTLYPYFLSQEEEGKILRRLSESQV
jgi:hypothetical protein